MCRRMVEIQVNSVYTCKQTSTFCPRSCVWGLESVDQYLNWIWVLLLVSIFTFSIPQTSRSSSSRLLLPRAWSTEFSCCRVFVVFLLSPQILVVSVYLAKDRGLSPCSCPFSIRRLVIACYSLLGLWQGLEIFSVVLIQPQSCSGPWLGVGLFQCFFSSASLVLYLQLLLGEFLVLPPALADFGLAWCIGVGSGAQGSF